MNLTINNEDALIKIEDVDSESRQITVEMKDPSIFAPRKKWVTKYPDNLINSILHIKGAAWLCDEIQREEDPSYTTIDIIASLFGYVSKSEMEGKQILDFGCGSGASTMILARLLPNSHIYGIELEEKFLNIGKQRADHYKSKNVSFLLSPSPEQLPEQIQQVDYILLSAVFEHLLPNERPLLLRQLWNILTPGGVLFINQTPDIRFPIETHTTGFPFVNYLPDSIAFFLARKISNRKLQDKSWESLLRAGIRGATPSEIMKLLSASTNVPILLNPKFNGFHNQSEIWYRSSRERLSKRYVGVKKKTILTLIDLIVLLGIPVAPYISLAIQKQKN